MIVSSHMPPAPHWPDQSGQSPAGTDLFGEAAAAVSFEDLLAPPTSKSQIPTRPPRSFEALGMFGRTGAISFDQSADQPPTMIEDLDTADDGASPAAPDIADNFDASRAGPPLGQTASRPPTLGQSSSYNVPRTVRPPLITASTTVAPEDAVDAPVSFVEEATGAEPEEAMQFARQAGATPTAEQDLVQLAVIIQNGGIEIVARSGETDTPARDAIRRKAEQIAAEYGLSVDALSLDGETVPSSPRLPGDAFHGRRSR